ncbi:MAG: TraR/DksA family transcriptional regulator [Akkermansiaceae bacterium]
MKLKNNKHAAGKIPQQWHWHYLKLQAIHESLLADRARQVAVSAMPLKLPGDNMADHASDEFMHDLTIGILAREDDAIHEVNDALLRILNGTYGICEMTGRIIPDARLRVVPWTRYTKDALESLERRRQVERLHLAGVASLEGSASAWLAQADEPDAEEPIVRETARLRREDGIRELAGAGALELVETLT